MKVEVKNQNKEFKPIELSITLESKRELQAFTAFMNCSISDKRDMINRNNGSKWSGAPFTADEVRFLDEVFYSIRPVLDTI